MDEFNLRRSHVPAFGSWDCNDDLAFTQCFESARQAGLLRYSYSEERDLYENDVVTPTMIVVPRHRGYQKEKEDKKEGWLVCECELKAPPSPVSASPTPPPKAVDQDLYRISPDLLRAHPKRKRAWNFFSSCLRPTFVR